MGQNCACTLVKLPEGRSRDDLIAEVERSYVRRGASRSKDGYRSDLQTNAIVGSQEKERHPLGVAISPNVGQWVTIIDSERYFADAALFRDLAARLDTSSFWLFTGDVSNSRMVVRLGKPFPWKEVPLGHQYEYYDQLEEGRRHGWTFLNFNGVSSAIYEETPAEAPRADLICRHCHLTWSWVVGSCADVEAPPSELELKKSLIAVREKNLSARRPFLRLEEPGGTRCRLLVALACPECGCPDASWAEANWEHGLIVGCTALPSRPERVEGFHFRFGPIPSIYPWESAGQQIGWTYRSGPCERLVTVDKNAVAVVQAFVNDDCAATLERARGFRAHPSLVAYPPASKTQVVLSDPKSEASFDRPSVFEVWTHHLLEHLDPPEIVEIAECTFSDWPSLRKRFAMKERSLAALTCEELEGRSGAHTSDAAKLRLALRQLFPVQTAPREDVSSTEDVGAFMANPRAERLGKLDRQTVFEAWLRAMLVLSADPVATEALLADATMECWPALHAQQGRQDLIVKEVGVQLDRLGAVHDALGSDCRTLRELFELASNDDRQAAILLEIRAVHARNFPLWRFARAVVDRKTVLANLYRGRVRWDT